jgi:hypothetical protein
MTCGSPSSRLAKSLRTWFFLLPTFSLPPLSDEFSNILVLGVRNRFPFNVDGAHWADLCAFSAGGARAGINPLIVQIHYDLGIFSSQFQIQRVNALNFVANP